MRLDPVRAAPTAMRGIIDRDVAEDMRDNYDLSHIIRRSLSHPADKQYA